MATQDRLALRSPRGERDRARWTDTVGGSGGGYDYFIGYRDNGIYIFLNKVHQSLTDSVVKARQCFENKFRATLIVSPSLTSYKPKKR